MRIHLVDDVGPSSPLEVVRRVGHPHILTSVLSAFRSGPKRFKVELQRLGAFDPSSHWILDSGLFSFMFSGHAQAPARTYEAFRDYTRRYLDMIDAAGFDGTIVEVDAQRLIGVDATKRLREEFAPLGDRVMYVWHEPEGLDGLVELARAKSYIGLGLPELRTISKRMGAKPNVLAENLLARIHEATPGGPPRIHLLGGTSPPHYSTRMVYSCDSTTWLNATKYGACPIFEEHGAKHLPVRSERFKAYVENVFRLRPDLLDLLEPHAAGKREYIRMRIASAFSYSRLQKWVDANITHVPMRGADLPGGPWRP